MLDDRHTLRERIEILEEENRQLREELMPELQFPMAWRLNGNRRKLLAMLYNRKGVVGYSSILVGLAGSDNDFGRNYISVFVSLTRSRLAPFGVEIHTLRGEGYFLPIESRRVITAALAAVAAGEVA